MNIPQAFADEPREQQHNQQQHTWIRPLSLLPPTIHIAVLRCIPSESTHHGACQLVEDRKFGLGAVKSRRNSLLLVWSPSALGPLLLCCSTSYVPKPPATVDVFVQCTPNFLSSNALQCLQEVGKLVAVIGDEVSVPYLKWSCEASSLAHVQMSPVGWPPPRTQS